jgi:hypothetical protein
MIMKKYILLLLIPFCTNIYSRDNFSFHAAADSLRSLPHNNASVAVGGNGCIVSLLYERFFRIREDRLIIAGIGLGYTEEFYLRTRNLISTALPKPYPYEYLVVPHYLTFNIGKNGHFFEMGLGGTTASPITQPYLFYPVLGYRYMHYSTIRRNFRVTVSLPFSKFKNDAIVYFPFGISIGMCF